MPEAIPQLPSPRTPGDEAGAAPTDSSGQRRYPLEPLLERIGGSHRDARALLGLSGTTEREYRCLGVTERVADRLAAKAGFVAYEVWPEIADHQVADAQRTCAGDDCDTRFVPYRSTSLYCSTRCSRRAGRRRRTAEQRERDAQALKAWKAANADGQRAYNRAYQRTYMRNVRRRAAAERAA